MEEDMKFDFPNSRGEIFSGSLVLPDTTPRAYALFAHCFTCFRDFITAILGNDIKTIKQKEKANI
jgi:hypothetical protein